MPGYVITASRVQCFEVLVGGGTGYQCLDALRYNEADCISILVSLVFSPPDEVLFLCQPTETFDSFDSNKNNIYFKHGNIKWP